MKRLYAHHLSFFFSRPIFIGCSKPKENVTDTKLPQLGASLLLKIQLQILIQPLKKPKESTNSNPVTPIVKPQPRLITDATIASHLTSTAGKPFGQLTEDELQAFRNLDLQGREVADLTGVNKLTQLENLSLGNNQVEDITGLSGMEYLTYLDLSTNRIQSLNGLDSLPNLAYLSIGGNQVFDVSLLSGLKTRAFGYFR